LTRTCTGGTKHDILMKKMWKKLEKKLSQNWNVEGDLLRSSIGSIIASSANKAAKALSVFLLARLLGAKEFGLYTWVLSVIIVLSIPIQLGIPDLLVRFVSKYDEQGENEKKKGVLRGAMIVGMINSMLAMVLIAATIKSGYIGLGSESSHVLLLGCVLLPLIVLKRAVCSYLKGVGYVTYSTTVKDVVPYIVIALLMLVIWMTNVYSITAEIIIKVHYIAVFSAICLGSVLIHNLSWKQMRLKSYEYEWKRWMNSAKSFVVVRGTQVVNSKADVVLLGSLASSSTVGIYTIALKLSELGRFGLLAINNAISPYISKYYEQSKSELIQSSVQKAALGGIIFAAPIGMVTIIYGEELIHLLFGNGYAEAYWPLVILVVGTLFSISSGPVVPILKMTDNEGFLSKSILLSAVINVSLNSVLIIHYGAIGASVATLVTYVVWNLILVTYSMYIIRVNPTILQRYV